MASLVPAATDLIIAMGAGNHLVAVSNLDHARPEIRDLPRVGDYQNTDWEKLRELRPDVMVIQQAPDRVPEGLRRRADNLKIRLINIQIEQVPDIFRAINILGAAYEEQGEAQALSRRLRQQLDSAAACAAGKPAVPALLATGENEIGVIGPRTFLDDLLIIAGGRNVVRDFKDRYPTVDREMVRKLAPQVVVHLLPDAAPHVVDDVRRMWQSMPTVPAVANGRVYLLTDWYLLQPGSQIGEVAGKLASLLHPAVPATQASTAGGRP